MYYSFTETCFLSNTFYYQVLEDTNWYIIYILYIYTNNVKELDKQQGLGFWMPELSKSEHSNT